MTLNENYKKVLNTTPANVPGFSCCSHPRFHYMGYPQRYIIQGCVPAGAIHYRHCLRRRCHHHQYVLIYYQNLISFRRCFI